MARPGLLSHRKFRALCRSVGDRALALGSLQLVWFSTWEASDPIVGTAEDVEHVACWKGTPGVLARAMFDAGFLDVVGSFPQAGLVPDPGAVFLVHDFRDHLPEYVRKRIEREKSRKDVALSGQTSGQDGGQMSGRTAAACPDERPPSGQGSSGQNRAGQGRSGQSPRGASTSPKLAFETPPAEAKFEPARKADDRLDSGKRLPRQNHSAASGSESDTRQVESTAVGRRDAQTAGRFERANLRSWVQAAKAVKQRVQ